MGTCEPRASHLIVQQQKYTLYRTHVWYEWKLAEHVFRAVGPCTVAAAPSLANRYRYRGQHSAYLPASEENGWKTLVGAML